MSFEEDLQLQAKQADPYKFSFFMHRPFDPDKEVHLDFSIKEKKSNYYGKDITSEPFIFTGLSFDKAPTLVEIVLAAKAKHPDVPILRKVLQKFSKVSVAIYERK